MTWRSLSKMGRAARPLVLLGLLEGCIDGQPYREHAVLGGDPHRGEEAIERYGCGSCHTIPGVRLARGRVGPPLSAWSERQYIAGNLLNTPDNLIRWIQFPDSVEPGTVMPVLGVSDRDARDIAAYLYTLGDPEDLGPPHLIPERWLRALMPGHSSQSPK